MPVARAYELSGTCNVAIATLPTGTSIVRTSQPLDLVAMCLLEPESGDVLVTWDFFDGASVGSTFPVRRITADWSA